MGRVYTRPAIFVITGCISPILIMLMLGSLVFFLIDVLYAGEYSSRLIYTFFFYVFGAVLIARIAIRESYSYASIYMIGLGGACFFAMITFVEYPDRPDESTRANYQHRVDGHRRSWSANKPHLGLHAL